MQYKNFAYENTHSSTRTLEVESNYFKMSLTLHNVYHPYYNSSLEFLFVHDLNQTKMSEVEKIDEVDQYKNFSEGFVHVLSTVKNPL